MTGDLVNAELCAPCAAELYAVRRRRSACIGLCFHTFALHALKTARTNPVHLLKYE